MYGAQRKILLAVGALVALVAYGTVGYRLVQGWPWFDCFYMTVHTLATIGYGEGEDMRTEGRAFTVSLIVLGVGTVGYAFSVLVQTIVHGELRSTLEKRRVRKAIETIEDHIIICGSGRVGTRVARELAREGAAFVVIERDEAKASRAADENWLVIAGDATDEEVLVRAGIERAHGLVCALPTDADNVYVTLSARDLSQSLNIVARVNDDSAISKMRKAGADKIISPLRTGAHEIVQALLRPSVAHFIEIATKTEELDLIIEEVRISPGSSLAGKTLRESNIRGELDIMVVAILRESGDMIFNPTGETEIHAGDNFIAIGSRAGVEGLADRAMAKEAETR